MADDLKEQKPAGKGTALIDGVLKEVKGLKDKALDDVQSLKKPPEDPTLQVDLSGDP